MLDEMSLKEALEIARKKRIKDALDVYTKNWVYDDSVNNLNERYEKAISAVIDHIDAWWMENVK
jgi:hypothetical protein